LIARLRAWSKRWDATLYMSLCAGFAILLSRLSSQDDIVIGAPVAGRQRPEIEELIGCFINTLMLRTDLSADPSVGALIKQIKVMTLSAYAHQDVPFEQVVEAVQPPRSLSHSPLFQAALALNNTPQPELRLPGLEVAGEEQAIPRSVLQLDLLLWLTEIGDDI